MAYPATVLRVMIASPSDTLEARDAVENAIHGWNNANSENKQIALLPWRWETSSVPVSGGHPQSLINSQGVDESDIIFALFGSRLGSPTPGAVSGTAEEIERAIEQGKPVHLYFSSASLPNDVDVSQLEGLRQFRSEMSKRALLGEFSNPSQLEHEVWKAIEHDIPHLAVDISQSEMAPNGVQFLVQPKQERELQGADKNGKPKYRTNYWLEISNTGDRIAEDVVFASAGVNPTMTVITSGEPTKIHAQQTRRLDVAYMMGVGEKILRIQWVENGVKKEEDFYVG
ncbi:MAG TPA: DUF4062 domain-containing protein [Enteractinococcus helveticum]|uniref:DUF4062 domain-containing protein n=1 Tax=Enteractinococcus helveticum TaxID=1837282 RepID=A0A921FPM0_9MICC|nr:DUF4062 domain-containing protein [Enteractinococcus helveticum]HJF15147.1 DUF4062 domain-containing protein [Enteractinococcus helveticum]